MGTRGIYGFVADKKEYLTYNHFDSYPEWLGINLINEMKELIDTIGITKIKKNISKLKLVNSEDKPDKKTIEKYKKYCNNSVGNGNFEWYNVLRNAQGTIKPYATGKIKHIIDSKNFIVDSLFCEWGYIFNFDTNKLEIYRGFQTKKHNKGRYANMKPYKLEFEPNTTYYPCALIKEYDLMKLPDLETLKKDLNLKD